MTKLGSCMLTSSSTIHNTQNKARNLELRVNALGTLTRYAHLMVNVSQEVITNSGKHSHATHSQISAKEEAGTAHPPHPFAENSWGSWYLCSPSSESTRPTLPYLDKHNECKMRVLCNRILVVIYVNFEPCYRIPLALPLVCAITTSHATSWKGWRHNLSSLHSQWASFACLLALFSRWLVLKIFPPLVLTSFRAIVHWI